MLLLQNARNEFEQRTDGLVVLGEQLGLEEGKEKGEKRVRERERDCVESQETARNKSRGRQRWCRSGLRVVWKKDEETGSRVEERLLTSLDFGPVRQGLERVRKTLSAANKSLP